MNDTVIPDVRDHKPWRYAPSMVMTLRGWSEVERYEYIPASARRDDYPIRKEFGVLILHCANGETRHYGFEDARINSELRFTVRLSGFHFRDEVIRKWEACEAN
jgi:hypothetical protein